VAREGLTERNLYFCIAKMQTNLKASHQKASAFLRWRFEELNATRTSVARESLTERKRNKKS
ncbi:MAG: hypothetical protein J6B67_04195, partial [Oscillospiraceae bacterium]|nr:hypothetical protein [Oscillospiraceae bacterium]